MKRVLRILSGLMLAAVLLPFVGLGEAGAVLPSPSNLRISPVGTPPGTVSNNPTMIWDAVPGAAQYHVQIASNAGFSPMLWEGYTFNTRYAYPFDLPQGTISWRVQALDATNTPWPFATSSFTKTAFTTPTPTSPLTGGAPLAFPDQPPTFTWQPVTGAKNYRIQVANNDTFTSPFVDTFTYATSYTWTEPLTPGQTYYWQVLSNSANDVPSNYSTAQSFTVGWDVSGLTTGQTPTAGANIEEVVLRWGAVKGATTYDVQLSPSADFASTIDYFSLRSTQFSPPQTLANGQYFWHVRARTWNGFTSAWTPNLDFTRGWPNDPNQPGPNGACTAASPKTPQVCVPPFNTVRLLTPANNSFTVSIPTFTWTPQRLGSSYQIEMSTDSGFSPGLSVSCVTDHTMFTPKAGCGVDPAPGITYYWHVRAIDMPAGIQGVYSPAFTFSYYPNSGSGGLVQLASPATGTVGLTTPVLTWNPMPNISRYLVTIKDKNASVVGQYSTLNTTYVPQGLLEINGPFTWYVQTQDAANRLGPFPLGGPNIRTFNVTAPVGGATPTPNASVPPGGSVYNPLLTWAPVTNATEYRIWFAVQGAAVYHQLNTGVTVTAPGWAHTGEDVGPGNYNYFVEAYNGAALLSTSGLGTFIVLNFPNTSLATPGGSFNCNALGLGSCQTIKDTPQLSWQPNPGAGGYIVYIADDKDFTTVIGTYVTQYPTIMIETSLKDSAANKATYWYARPCKNPYSQTFCGPHPNTMGGDQATIYAFRKASPQVGNPITKNDNLVKSTTFTNQVTFQWDDYLGTNEDGRTVHDATTTNGSATLVSATAAFVASDVGKPISGTNIPNGTTIASVTNGTTVQLSQNATASGTNLTAVIGNGNGGRTIVDAVTTAGSPTLTSATAGFTAADVGRTIAGPNIANSASMTKINAVNSATSVTLSANATVTGTTNAVIGDPPDHQEAKYYLIRVSDVADMSHVIDQKFLDQTTYTPYDINYPVGAIYWTVQAYDNTSNPLTAQSLPYLTATRVPATLTGLSDITRVISDGSTTLGSTSITSAQQGFTANDVGKNIAGTNIPANATIVSVNGNSAVLSAAATGTGSSQTFKISASHPGPTPTLPSTPTFAWNPAVFVAQYEFELYKDPAVNGLGVRLWNQAVRQSAISPNIVLTPGQYGWRVRGYDASGNPLSWTSTTAGGLATFNVGQNGTTLNLPTENSTTLGNNLYFTWAPVAGATSYRLETSPSSSFAGLQENVVTVMTAWAPQGVYPDGQYYFRVTTLDAGGQPIAVNQLRGGNAYGTFNVGVPGARFKSLPPTRILDTRFGPGFTGKLTAGVPQNLAVTGVAGVPASASAVVVNVTATGGSNGSFLTVYPNGAALPNASNVNFGPGETIPNLVTVKVGSGGAISFANAVGTVDVIADIVGYYDDGNTPANSLYNGINPVRFLDSRTGTGWSGKLNSSTPRELQIVGVSGIPASATAVVMNVTATGGNSGSFLTVYPSLTALPNASNVNFGPGQTIPNLAIVQIGTNGKVTFANAVGTVDVVADVVGYYTPSTGDYFHALSPVRILDSRVNNGLNGKWGPATSRNLQVTGRPGINVPGNATGLVMNTTVTGGTAGSFLTVYPTGTAKPNASNLNFGPGQTIPNLVMVKMGTGGQVAIYNELGQVDVIGDAVGYFGGP